MVPRLFSPDSLTCAWMAHIMVFSDDGGCCQVLQQEVERLEARAALVEEEASRAGQLEEEAVARGERLRALQEKARAHNFDTRQNLQQYNSSNRVGLFFSCQQRRSKDGGGDGGGECGRLLMASLLSRVGRASRRGGPLFLHLVHCMVDV